MNVGLAYHGSVAAWQRLPIQSEATVYLVDVNAPLRVKMERGQELAHFNVRQVKFPAF